MSALGEQLRMARMARDLSLREAADQMKGVSFNTLSRIERGLDCSHAHAEAVYGWIGIDVSAASLTEAWALGYAEGVAAARRALERL